MGTGLFTGAKSKQNPKAGKQKPVPDENNYKEELGALKQMGRRLRWIKEDGKNMNRYNALHSHKQY